MLEIVKSGNFVPFISYVSQADSGLEYYSYYPKPSNFAEKL